MSALKYYNYLSYRAVGKKAFIFIFLFFCPNLVLGMRDLRGCPTLSQIKEYILFKNIYLYYF